MPVTLLDLAVLGVVLVSALLAAVRGFTREVLSIVSWAAAGVAAYVLHPYLLPFARDYIPNATGALVASIAAVFLVTLVVVSLITVRISDFVLDSRIGFLDRSLGFAFGAARGGLICVILFLFFSWFVTERTQPTWVKEARARPLLETSGQELLALLPEDPEGVIKKLKARRLEGGAEPADAEPAPTAPGRRTDAAPDSGSLERVIQTGRPGPAR